MAAVDSLWALRARALIAESLSYHLRGPVSDECALLVLSTHTWSHRCKRIELIKSRVDDHD